MAIIATLFMVLAVWVASLNWYVAFSDVVLRRPAGSWVPFVGGALGCVGFWLAPINLLKEYWWLPLLLDWGCIPGFVFTGSWFLFYGFPKQDE